MKSSLLMRQGTVYLVCLSHRAAMGPMQLEEGCKYLCINQKWIRITIVEISQNHYGMPR